MEYRDGYLSIGEFSQLIGASRATLVHYDDMGVLKPAKVEDNGYRYYLPNQAQTYLVILLFAECGLTLRDIKEYLDTFDMEKGEQLVEHALRSVKSNIRRLSQVQKLMEGKRRLYEISLGHEYGEPFIARYAAKPYILSTVRRGSFEHQQIQTDHSISICRYVADHGMFPEHPFAARIEVSQDSNGGWELSPAICHDAVDVQEKEEGLYACVLQKGSNFSVEKVFEALCSYIEAQGYRPVGPLYLVDTVNFVVTSDEDEYSTMLQIRVVKIVGDC